MQRLRVIITKGFDNADIGVRNMKKISLLLGILLLLCSFCLLATACGEKYQLTVIDPSNLIVEPLKNSYKVGKIVTVKVDILMDAYVVVYLDGKECKKSQTDGESPYWEFYFEMPDRDATLTLEIKEGFLP